jgi:hypothetical protein
MGLDVTVLFFFVAFVVDFAGVRDFCAGVFRGVGLALGGAGAEDALLLLSVVASASAAAAFRIAEPRGSLEELLFEHHRFLKRHLPQRCPGKPEHGDSSRAHPVQGVDIFSCTPLMYICQPICDAPALA